MCRFSAYIGTNKLLVDELIIKPKDGLYERSKIANPKRRAMDLDGCGLAWYDFDIDNRIGLFTSTKPLWQCNNLLNLSQKITSNCFLGHIRAANIGAICEQNTHPFVMDNYAMAHEGQIENFGVIKRSLINTLDEDLFLNIKGNTDSEHLFALIIQFLRQNSGNIIEATTKAIQWIIDNQKNQTAKARLNLIIIHQHEILATRFASTLHEATELYFCSKQDRNQSIESLMISSEAIGIPNATWQLCKKNHYIYCNIPKNTLEVDALNILL